MPNLTIDLTTHSEVIGYAVGGFGVSIAFGANLVMLYFLLHSLRKSSSAVALDVWRQCCGLSFIFELSAILSSAMDYYLPIAFLMENPDAKGWEYEQATQSYFEIGGIIALILLALMVLKFLFLPWAKVTALSEDEQIKVARNWTRIHMATTVCLLGLYVLAFTIITSSR
jgi:hypothetical protein